MPIAIPICYQEYERQLAAKELRIGEGQRCPRCPRHAALGAGASGTGGGPRGAGCLRRTGRDVQEDRGRCGGVPGMRGADASSAERRSSAQDLRSLGDRASERAVRAGRQGAAPGGVVAARAGSGAHDPSRLDPGAGRLRPGARSRRRGGRRAVCRGASRDGEAPAGAREGIRGRAGTGLPATLSLS